MTEGIERNEYQLPIPAKVYAVLTGEPYESPDAYDNLPEIIRWTTGFLRDPWVPHGRRPELKRLLDEATAVLTSVAG